MDEEVIIPLKLDIDTSDLSELKQEVQKTFSDAHKYESKFSAKGEIFQLKGVAELEHDINNAVENIAQSMQKFERLSFDTPRNALAKLRATVNGMGEDIRQRRRDVKGLEDALLESQKNVAEGEKEITAVTKERIALEKQYKKDVNAVDPEAKGAKSKLRDLEKQYKIEMDALAARERMANTIVNTSKKSGEQYEKELDTVKKSLSLAEERIAAVRKERDEMYNISRSEKRTNEYIDQRIQKMKELNALILKERDAINSGTGAVQEKLEDDMAKTGVSLTSKYDKAVAAEAERQRKEEMKQLQERERVLLEEYKIRRAIQEDETKREAAATKQLIANKQKEIAAVKQSAAQYYYKLRAVKMLGFAINNVTKTITSFGKTALKVATDAFSAYSRLIPGVSLLRNTFSSIQSSHSLFNRDMSTTRNEVISANGAFRQQSITLKELITNALKYGLGLRSLYVIFNRLRSAMSAGMQNLALQFEEVNQEMSSIVTSLFQMKNAVATAAQPLLSVLAPALEKVAEIVSDIAYKVASFIAALTGMTQYVYKAKRAQQTYVDKTGDAVDEAEDEADAIEDVADAMEDEAEAMEDEAEAAEELRKELSKLDRLNVLTSDQDKDSAGTSSPKAKKEKAAKDKKKKDKKEKEKDLGDGVQDMFEKVPIDPVMAEWAEKFKDLMERLFKPIANAWDNTKDFVIDSFKKMLNSMLELGKSIARDFWKVWEEPETQLIFENLFNILGDVFLIIANIADAIKEAWDYEVNGLTNGYRILSAIRDVILIITTGMKELADYTVKWSEDLNLVPLFTSVADVLTQQVVPATQKIVDLFVYLAETVVLELIRYIAEDLSPVLIRAAGNIIEAIGNIAENIRTALEDSDKGKQIIAKIEEIASKVAATIERMSEKTKEWAKDLDFNPFFDALLRFLDKIQPALDFLFATVEKFWNDVLLPFWKYMIEDGGPKLLDVLGKIFGEKYVDEDGNAWGIDWEHLTEVVGKFLDALEPFFEKAWETLVIIIEDLGRAFDELVNSGALDKLVDAFVNWVENADPEDLAHKIENFAEQIIGAVLALNIFSSVVMPLITTVMTFVNFFMQSKMTTKVARLTTKIGKLAPELGAAAGTSGGGGFTGLAASMGPIAGIIAGVIAVVALMVASFGGVEETLDELKERFDTIKKNVEEFAEKIGISEDIDKLKDSFGRLKDEFDNLFGSLEVLRPVFEALLDLLTEVFSSAIESAVGIIDGLVIAFDGIVLTIDSVITAIEGFIAFLTGDPVTGIEKFEEAGTKAFVGFGEVAEGAVVGLGEALAGFTSDSLPWVSQGITDFCNSTKDGFAWLKNQLIGDPIVYDMRDGIIEGFDAWINSTAESVGTWVTDRITDFTTLATEVLTDVTTMKDDVVTAFENLKDGAKEKSESLLATAKEKFESVKTTAREKLAESQFVQFGNTAVKGIESGIKAFGSVISAATSDANQLKSNFRSGLPASFFRSIGTACINGLKEGLLSALNSVLSAVTEICNKIKSKVQEAFQTHSPSRVFEKIGGQLMEGLVVGIEDGESDVEDTFDSLVPSEDMLDTFYDKFMDMIEKLTNNATGMYDEMFAHIETTMQGLENLMSMSDMYKGLDNLPQLKTPDIVSGYTLPSNKEFKNGSSSVDLSKLPDIIKGAVMEAIYSTSDLQTSEGDTIINIDGKEIFRVVRNENSSYIKQHGVSAFA